MQIRSTKLRAIRTIGLRWWVLIAIGKLLGTLSAAEITEYDIKALYLYNFTRFVTWPADGEDTPKVIRIGIWGDNPFGDSLERVVHKQTSEDVVILVSKATTFEEANACNLLFVSASEKRNLGHLLSAIADSPILTVADDESFVLRGCVLGFYLESGTVQIAVNERAAERSRLVLSSKLLRIAKAL